MSWARIEPKRSSPAPRHCHSSVSWAGKIYIFGGTNGKDKYNDVHVFDPSRSSWSKLKTTGHQPSPRYCAAMGLHKDNLIVFGGFDGSRNNSVYSLNLLSGHWTLLLPAVGSSVPMPRSHHCLTIIGNSMYIFGGLSEEAKLLCDLHVFDLEKLVWKALTPEGTGPCGRINHSAHILGNFFVVFGGYDGKLRLNDLFLLNLETITWTIPIVHGTAPSRRLGHSSVVAGDKLVVFGGDDGNKERELLNDLHIFDLPSMRWYMPELGGCSPPQGRTHASACVTSEDQVWIIDGSNSQKTKLDEIYRLDVSSLYLFQKMFFDRASADIIQSLEDSYRKLQVRTNLSTHLATKRNSPPAKRSRNQTSESATPLGVATLSTSGQIPTTSAITVPWGHLISNVTLPVSTGVPSAVGSPPNASLFDLPEESVTNISASGEGPHRSRKSQKKTERSENSKERSPSMQTAGCSTASSSSTSVSAAPTSVTAPNSLSMGSYSTSAELDDRPARSPKRTRRPKPASRSTSAKRELSPPPAPNALAGYPTSPNELSPATSPRGALADLGTWATNSDDYENNYDGSGNTVTFADQGSEEQLDDDEEPSVLQRVRRILNAIKQSFHQLEMEKDSFIQLRQERQAVIAEAGSRDTTQGHELNRLVQQQRGRVILNVGGHLFNTSVITLTKYPDSMLATMFSGRHTLLPEADGTYFIDRDGTYFRYILNYLRCGDDAVLEAKPSVLAEILAEARFYQLEGLKDAIQEILSDPELSEESIVEY